MGDSGDATGVDAANEREPAGLTGCYAHVERAVCVSVES